MPHPFFRPDEAPRRTPESRSLPGVRVVFPNRVVHFFPGATPELGAMLARLAVPDDLMSHPDTWVEFGDRIGSAFIPTRVLKQGKKREEDG